MHSNIKATLEAIGIFSGFPMFLLNGFLVIIPIILYIPIGLSGKTNVIIPILLLLVFPIFAIVGCVFSWKMVQSFSWKWIVISTLPLAANLCFICVAIVTE